jgi:hypothetical protein
MKGIRWARYVECSGQKKRNKLKVMSRNAKGNTLLASEADY